MPYEIAMKESFIIQHLSNSKMKERERSCRDRGSSQLYKIHINHSNTWQPRASRADYPGCMSWLHALTLARSLVWVFRLPRLTLDERCPVRLNSLISFYSPDSELLMVSFTVVGLPNYKRSYS